jgi:hypothetical protein
MAKVTVKDGMLRLKLKGIDRVLAFRSRLEVPLAHVTGASIYTDIGSKHPWLGVGASPGAAYPDARVVRGMWQQADWVFWDVHDVEKAVVIELADEHYARLVVEVEDPQAVVTDIKQAIAITSQRAGLTKRRS